MVRGGKLIVLSLIILVILSTFVYSQLSGSDSIVDEPTGFDLDVSYSWLYERLVNMTAPTDVRSLATIALIQRGSGQFSGLIEEINDLEDQTQNCWPATGCKVKDTALATLALALAGQDVSEEVEWLNSAKIAGLPPGGEWSIAIKSDSDGVCSFGFTGVEIEREFTLEGDFVRLPTGSLTAQQYYVRLNELHPTLATGSVQPEISVNCEVINPIITLLYKPNVNTFFIQRSDAGASLNFKVANACFGNTRAAGPCNYETTAFATWALLEIGSLTNNQSLSLENIGTHIYLETQAINKRNDPIALGLINRILIKASNAAPSFISDLVSLQRISDGSWGNSVVATSIATFGLTGSNQGEAVIRGSNYLRGVVNDDGSWNNDLETTAWALIALHGGDLSRVSVFVSEDLGSAIEICGNGFDDDQDGVFDCDEIECASDPVCQCQNSVQDGDEEGRDCGGSCSTDCDIVGEPECTIDADCLSGEVCVSGTCVFESVDTDDEDFEDFVEPEDEEGSLWWLWLIIILLILGGVLFYLSKKGKINLKDLFKRKPKKPTFEEYKRQAQFRPAPQKPIAARPSPIRGLAPRKPINVAGGKSKEDIELEKSMREAQRILRGE